MKLFEDIFYGQQIRLLNHTNVPTVFSHENNAILSFALEDAIATIVGQTIAPATVRLWVHDRTLVLGIPDSRLHHLAKGVQLMRALDYEVIIRNSGGLAVLLDENVLNISFILPHKRQLSITEGYELMYYFTRRLLEKEGAEILAYEIVGSYCPGDYDLSIDGKKFAGISQRRVRNGVAVQMYLDVAGSSYERADIVRKFYNVTKGEHDSAFTYPDVNPHVMASLNELLQTNFTVETMIERIKALFSSVTKMSLATELLDEEKPIFHERLQQMKRRNNVIQQLT